MKLKTKIQLFSSLFMIVLLVLINSAIYFLFYNISADHELDEVVTQTNSIVETLNQSQDIPEKELLQAYLPTNGTIQVIEESGERIIPILTKKEAYRNVPSTFARNETREIIKNEEGIHVAIVQRPIIWEDGTVVTLQVSNHLIILKETMQNLSYVLLLAALLMLIPTILAGNVLSRFLLKPVQTLIKAMKDNTEQENWNKIDVQSRSRDELYVMEETFNKMIDHLKENFERQEQFVSDASHELKTPISIIKSYAELLQRRGKTHPEVFDESLEAIRSESDRMQQLVEQMLVLAKDKTEATVETIDLVPLCKETVQTFQKAYNRQVNLNVRARSILIEGVPGQIEQVIYILVDNALKYSEKEILLELMIEQNQAVLKVTDQGTGISEEEQKRIFDRFYRVDKARSRETGGTGLGLAIAKSIVKQHSGTLSVKSKFGEGSTFIVELPLLHES